jgi:hypothetical protein
MADRRDLAQQKRWQDWLNLFLGIWLFVSPWLLGYSNVEAAAGNSWIFGIAVAAVAGSALANPAQWQEWVNLVLGAWLLISPWALGFSFHGAATWNHAIVGIVVGVAALWAATTHRGAYTATR